MTDRDNNYQGRVIRERDELKILLDRLELFNTTPRCAMLPMSEQSRLSDQERYMRGYHEAVCKRIARFSLDA